MHTSFAILVAVMVASASAMAFVDPCAQEAKCAPSGSSDATQISCGCEYINAANISFTRNYTLSVANATVVAVWQANFPLNISNGSSLQVSWENPSGQVFPLVNVPEATASYQLLSGTSATLKALQGSITVNFNNSSEVNGTLSFSLSAIPCTVTKGSVANQVVSWDKLPNANFAYVVEDAATSKPAAGTVNPDGTFALNKSCGFINLVLRSNYTPTATPCADGFAINNVPLTSLPDAPTTVNVNNFNFTFNATGDDNTSSLSVLPWWNTSNSFDCAPSTVIYYAELVQDGNVVYSWTISSSSTVVTDNTVTLKNAAVLTRFNVDWNAQNSVYTFNVWGNTAIGNSTKTGATFTLPGYNAPTTAQPTTAPSSSSGLSNTVIAGIAVGATVGVVAIALIIYKCSSSRKGYSSIGGESSA